MPVSSAADLSRVTTAAVNRIMQLWEGAGKCYVLIVGRYTEKEQADGVRVIYNLDRPLCPVCGGSLSGYDRRRRVVLDDTGQPSTYLLRRLWCTRCRRLHLEMPDSIRPHKHYSAQLITETISGAVDSCPADDSTIRRWKKSGGQ